MRTAEDTNSGARTASEVSVPRFASILSDVVVVVTLAVLSIATSVSFVALVFSGPLEPGISIVATSVVIGGGITAIIIGWRSGFEMVVADSQDTPAIILAPAAAAIAVSASAGAAVVTVIVAVAITTLTTGVLMWIIGRAGLARTVRFLPTTVVVGFLAGTGYFLVKGAIEVMVRSPVGLSDIGELLSPDELTRWLPGVVLAIAILGASTLPRLVGAAGLFVLVVTVGYFIGVAVFSSVDAVEAGGWLIGPFAEQEGLRVVSPTDLADADWAALGGQAGSIAAAVLLSVIGLLLNLPGIRLLQRSRVDPDAELRSAGITNIVIAPIGGMTGYHMLSGTALAQTVGVTRRWVAVAAGATTCVLVVVSSSAISLLPRFVAGGLLCLAGLSLIVEWVRSLRATESWFDRAISVLIVVTMAAVGILQGIIVGIVAACVFFAVRYSRIDAIRRESTLADRRSVVERPPSDSELLDARGGQVVVVELHGYLFFGSVSGASERVRKLAAGAGDGDPSAVRLVLVDLTRVSGIDSSAFAAFDELVDDITSAGTGLWWSGLGDETMATLQRTVRQEIVHHPTLDRSIELAEDELLAVSNDMETVGEPDEAGRCKAGRYQADQDEAGQLVPYSDELLEFFERREHVSDEQIVCEGDDSDALIVLADGGLRVERMGGGGTSIRLRTLRPGAVIGELGFLTGDRRTASVVATEPSATWWLTADAHRRLRAEHPDLALELYDHVLAKTADRATAIHRSLTDAQD